MIADFGAKLLKRSMLPARKFASAAVFDELWMSTTYRGAGFRPSGFVRPPVVARFQTNVCDVELAPDWYVYGPVPTIFLASRLPVVMSVVLSTC